MTGGEATLGDLTAASWRPAGLWLAVVASGLYHGLNPGMGWPLAVSAGLMERSSRAFGAALGWLAAGHLVAMLAATLPFAMLTVIVAWQREIQIAAGLAVVGFGLYLLIQPRHPRALARIPPTRLALWSFAIAMAHGAGLMLVPIYLGLCRSAELDAGHQAASALINANLAMALIVATVHTMAMFAAGGALAWVVYRHLGPAFIARSWFNLDAVWAVSLVLVGGLSLVLAMTMGG